MVKPVEYGYKTVLVREELLKRVKKIVEARIGYRSMSEFINEAIRIRLEQIESNQIKRINDIVYKIAKSDRK